MCSMVMAADVDSVLTVKDTVRLREVQVMGRSRIRKLKESGMPVTVIGQHQLQGTAFTDGRLGKCLSVETGNFNQCDFRLEVLSICQERQKQE